MDLWLTYLGHSRGWQGERLSLSFQKIQRETCGSEKLWSKIGSLKSKNGHHCHVKVSPGEPWWGAHVVMLNRKSGRAEEAEKKLLEEAPGSKVASIFRMLKICEDCEICEIYVF